MDNSWWLELGGIRLLIDPWLEGVEVDYFSWLNTQWHATPPLDYEALPPWDGVLLTQKYPDHFHPDSLKRLAPKRIWAPESTEKALRRILPEASLSLFSPAVRRHTIEGLRIVQLASPRRIDPIYEAFLLDDGVESILVAPHGFALDEEQLAALQKASPCRVLLSCFDEYTLPAWLGGRVSPGLEGLRQLVAQVNPECVIQTHDEPKHGRGLVPRLARIRRFSEADLFEAAWLRERYRAVSDYAPVEI